MTGVFDRIRVGKAPPPANAFAQVPPQSGAPTSPAFIHTTVPAPADSKGVATGQIVNNGKFTLGTTFSGVAPTFVTIAGQSYLDLGSARVLQYLGLNASSAAVTITVSGFEETVLSDGSYGPGQAMSEAVTSPSGVGQTLGKKAFRYIGAVGTNGNTVSGVAIGTLDQFGVPVIIPDAGFGEFFWNGAQDTTSTHFTLPDTTSPATSTTGDVRGTYAPPSASTGTRRLVVWISVNNPDTLAGVYGQPQA